MDINLRESKTMFLSHLLRRGMSKKTITAYDFDLSAFFLYLCDYFGYQDDATAVAIVQKTHIVSWVDACLSNGNSPRTISRKLSVLKSYFRYLHDENLIESNPAEKIMLPKARKTIPDAISQDEIRQMFEIIHPESKNSIRNRAIIVLLYSCGLRVSEITDLKIENFRIDREIIHVLGKGAKERDVPLSKMAIASIRDYLEHREMDAPDSVYPKAYLFVTPCGQKMTVRMIQYMVEKYGREAGVLSHVHPHLIRHSIATHLIEEGADVESVRQTLGHESLATTSIYLKTASKYLKDAHRAYNPADRLFGKKD